jgi:class IV lanthipeptide synthase
MAGLSQVGKVITIYPSDDDQLIWLALELDKLTSKLDGPRIYSDRPVNKNSLVHYRYGTFIILTYQNAAGQIIPAIRTPDGELPP